ncbi:MAG: PulJ/GspJ family protein [Akkermansiaceae bacterium]
MKFEIRNTNSQTVQKKALKGFTLIELLISMTITLVIVGLLMGMTKMAVGAWQATNAKARSSRLAQEVFDSVGKDLEGIVIRTGNNYEWVLIKESGISGDDLGQGANKELVNPLEISFFSAVTDRYNGQINSADDLGGDISMVRYRLIHQDVVEAGGAKPVFSLYRQRIEPKQAFDELLAKTSIDGVVPSAEIVERENYLAENIFDFTLSFNFEYTDQNGKKGYKRVSIQADGVNNSLSIKGNEVLVGGTALTLPSGASSPRLASADVSILVLSDSGMNALKTRPISSAEEFSKFLTQNGHHYSKSVILPQP